MPSTEQLIIIAMLAAVLALQVVSIWRHHKHDQESRKCRNGM